MICIKTELNLQALWQEIDSSRTQTRENTKGSGHKGRQYRHDENVIESEPTAFRQIVIPRKSTDVKEYVTDDGLVIPSITPDLHKQLIGAADRFGISWERRVSYIFKIT